MALRLSCFYLMQVHVAWYIIVLSESFSRIICGRFSSFDVELYMTFDFTIGLDLSPYPRILPLTLPLDLTLPSYLMLPS